MITETEDSTPDPGEKAIRIRSVSHGYQYRVYTGTGSIVGGGAPTEEKAREKAHDVIMSLGEDNE